MKKCPACQAVNDRGQTVCWLCRAELAGVAFAKSNDLTNLQTFGLSSILLTITLISVCLGVVVQVPGLGIPLIALAIPAMIRTIGIGRRRKIQGQRMTAGEKIIAYCGSLAVVIMILFATLTTFVLVCFPIGLVGFSIADNIDYSMVEVPLLYAGWIGGATASIWIGILVARRIWAPKH